MNRRCFFNVLIGAAAAPAIPNLSDFKPGTPIGRSVALQQAWACLARRAAVNFDTIMLRVWQEEQLRTSLEAPGTPCNSDPATPQGS